jgi:hypothetical protein
MWNDLFRYEDGKLYWLPRENHNHFNSRNAGKEAGFIKKSTGYRQVTFRPKVYLAHRIIWEMHNGKIPDGYEVDHINANRSDNRIENLQLLSSYQNSLRGKERTSKGYVKRGNRYQASKKVNKQYYHIGMFGTPCGAYMASKMYHLSTIQPIKE